MFVQFAYCARQRAIALMGIAICIAITGCTTSYSVPGKPTDFKALGVTRESLTDTGINQTLARQPLATFPCAIAAVRIQAPGYRSDTAETFGTGNFCVITTRDIESDADWNKLKSMPMCNGVAALNRLLLPNQLNSDLELRQAAATLHADMLLIYTLDTSFHVEDHLFPLSVVTLGLSPNDTAQVVTTASAVLIDTRNGYLYGYAEETEKGAQLTNGWMTDQAVSDVRKRTESKAFAKLVTSMQGAWGGVVKNYGTASKAQQGTH